ncbi:MAG: alginate lyase family protein [bacterium]|nr:alginate lyase family protein [bacterium]
MDRKFLEKRIKHITDEDLFSALKLGLPGLKQVRKAVLEGDYDTALSAWHAYMKKRLARNSAVGEANRREDQNRVNVIEEADLVVARDIKCWGGIRIQYDGEIDFSRNLGGSSNYGFHYFGWMSPLAAAYRLTGEEKYAQAFVEIFMQWYRQRDLVVSDLNRLDVIWYELGTNRARVFRDHYFATIRSEAAHNSEFQRMFMKTMLGHARWLYQHETAYQPGNWQVFGTQTLTGLGISFPEFRKAGMWTRRGLKWILEHTRRDVYEDGCHKERAPHYHLGVIHSFWDVYRTLIGVPDVKRQRDAIARTMEQMTLWTLGMQTPSGHSPTVGDSEYDIPQGDYLRMGLIRRNPGLVWASGASRAKVREAAENLGVKKPVVGRKPKEATVHHLSSGFAIVRSGWGEKDFYFNVNYGPYGGGHSHSEALAFQMWAGGRPLAVDCGRGVSYDDPLHQTWYKTVYAHNTVAVDGEGPSIKGRKGRVLFWEKTRDVDFMGLSHRGYEEMGVRHTRCLLLNRKYGYAVVLDFLTAGEDHTYEWILNTPRKVKVKKGLAQGDGFSVMEAQQGPRSKIGKSTVKMALPLEGKTTWGMEREDGTNLRIEKKGSSMEYAVLIAPFDKELQFGVEAAGARSRYLKDILGEGPGFRHAYRVDCKTGEITLGK